MVAPTIDLFLSSELGGNVSSPNFSLQKLQNMWCKVEKLCGAMFRVQYCGGQGEGKLLLWQ